MDGSCGFVLQNEFWIGGGWGNDGANRRQEGIFKPIVHSAIKNDKLENHGKACEDTKLYAHESIEFAI